MMLLMLTVNDLMTVDPQTISPDVSLAVVSDLLQVESIRQLPVMDNGRLVGIISERDVCLVRNSPLFETISAESIMTANPITVTPETPAFRAAEMLRSYKFGALPVLDGDQLVGIITVSDFLRRMEIETTPIELWDDDQGMVPTY